MKRLLAGVVLRPRRRRRDACAVGGRPERPASIKARRWLAGAVFALALSAAPASAEPPDCAGPAPNVAPGSGAWHQREQDNAYCGEQRFYDTTSNPAFQQAKVALDARNGREVEEDPFRDPLVLGGVRFRYRRISFRNQSGQTLPGYVFLPCDGSCHDKPAALGTYRPPYPGVVIVHGGGASQEMYWWAAEGLAESGYMVLTFQIPEPDNAEAKTHYANTKAALDYFLSRPGTRPDFNPFWAQLDRAHIGLAGHSAGGVAVSQLGQEDPRVSAIVSWDRAQSTPMPAGLHIRTPALFFVADYLCQKVPVCIPQPYTSPPDPRGPGTKDQDFQRVAAAGVDTMKVTLRAATHLDFTQLSPGTGSRYGAAVALYYTRAWFDRYLKGASLARLVATRFDDSADIHNISGGTYDAATGKNVPAFIGGQRVADRLSFDFRSAYFLAGGRYRCDDMRAGCPPPGAAGGAGSPHGCLRPRVVPRAVPVRHGRARFRPRVLCAGRAVHVRLVVRSGRPRMRMAAGRRVSVPVGPRQRYVWVGFTLDGRAHRVRVRLERVASSDLW